MALVKCPEPKCGTMVSDQASICPACGFPSPGSFQSDINKKKKNLEAQTALTQEILKRRDGIRDRQNHFWIWFCDSKTYSSDYFFDFVFKAVRAFLLISLVTGIVVNLVTGTDGGLIVFVAVLVFLALLLLGIIVAFGQSFFYRLISGEESPAKLTREWRALNDELESNEAKESSLRSQLDILQSRLRV